MAAGVMAAVAPIRREALQIRGVQTPCFDTGGNAREAVVFMHGNPRGLPKAFVNGMYDHYDRGTRRAILRLYRATNDLDGAADAAHAALAPLDLDCLVIWAKRDPYVPWRFAEQQRKTFPRADIVYLEDSGHWPFIDNPQAVTAALIPFLRNLAGKA